MTQHIHDMEDTIVAIATPAGFGSIGVVRLSGDKAVEITDKVCLLKSGRKLSSAKNFSVNYGWIMNPNSGSVKPETVDEVLITVMRAPKSYTKENVVEISSHGGPVVLKAVISLILEHGARLAEPGEFTKRAFLNGRIDLAQAEAVLDIIQSKTETFLRISNHQLKGELSVELENLRTKLLEIYTEIEAIVNFPEDELDAQGKEKILNLLREVSQQVNLLAESGEKGKVLRDGIKIVLCGRPNVGKSSLLNALLRQPRAIVTDIAGTTRDTIEETAQIKGIPLQLVDTAGILEPRDLVEEEAIRRSQLSIERADLILLILDGTAKISEDDVRLINKIKDKNVLVVINKCDLKNILNEKDFSRFFPDGKVLKVSAAQKTGITGLEDAIIDTVWHGRTESSSDILVTNVRHVQALKNCYSSLLKAEEILAGGLSLEFASEEIKSAVHALDAITGRDIDADLLDKIFSSFCIGK